MKKPKVAKKSFLRLWTQKTQETELKSVVPTRSSYTTNTESYGLNTENFLNFRLVEDSEFSESGGSDDQEEAADE